MWRIYSPQWLTFFTSAATGEAGRSECEARFREEYEGRIEPADMRIESPAQAYGRSFLQLRVPNCGGEWPDRGEAERHAGEHPGLPHQVVEAGSAEERELRAYGTRRLRRP